MNNFSLPSVSIDIVPSKLDTTAKLIRFSQLGFFLLIPQQNYVNNEEIFSMNSSILTNQLFFKGRNSFKLLFYGSLSGCTSAIRS